MGVYILSAGKLDERPGEAPVSASATLGQLFDSYRERFPSAAKEESTLQTERIHLRHLERLLGANALLDGLTPKRMQAYADARAAEKGLRGRTVRSDTVRKELGTFSFVWNR